MEDDLTATVEPRGQCPICESAENYHHNAGSNEYQWCDQCGWGLDVDGKERIPTPCLGCGQVVATDIGSWMADVGLGGGGTEYCNGCGMAHSDGGSRAAHVHVEEFHLRESVSLGHVPDGWAATVLAEMIARMPSKQMSVQIVTAGDVLFVGEFGSYGGLFTEAKVSRRDRIDLPHRKSPVTADEHRAFAVDRALGVRHALDMACSCDECDLCAVRRAICRLVAEPEGT